MNFETSNKTDLETILRIYPNSSDDVGSIFDRIDVWCEDNVVGNVLYFIHTEFGTDSNDFIQLGFYNKVQGIMCYVYFSQYYNLTLEDPNNWAMETNEETST